MSANNIYKQVQSLQKSPIEPGGLCSLSFFKIEDVDVWPDINPQTNIISTAILMKPNTNIYLCQAADKGRQWEEELKYEAAGPYIDLTVSGRLGGTNTANLMTLIAGSYSKFGIIAKDRQGFQQLVGDEDSGATLFWKYATGDGAAASRMVDLKWTWSRAAKSILYQAQNFQISIGGVIVTAGYLKLLASFVVGTPGAPMADGDTVYTSPLLVNKKILILINGAALQMEDGSNTTTWVVGGVTMRHAVKILADDHFTLVGAAASTEQIQIYEIN
jgi:hypothetical protein